MLIILITFGSSIYAQDIKNTLGTNGNFEVITSSNTETLTVTNASQVIISDIATPTAKTDVLLDLNSINKTLQLPLLTPAVWSTINKGPGRIFWNVQGGAGTLYAFTGTGPLDFISILDTRSLISSLADVRANISGDGSSYYIGTDAGLAADEDDNNNVAFGVEALKNLNSINSASNEAEENVAIGHQASLYTNSGTGNTAIGAQAGVAEFSGTLNYTTAIGYNATPDEDNQIRLGRDVDHVVVPGVLKVQDMLNLKPRASAPANPQLGDMYYDSGINRIRVWAGAPTAVWEIIAWQ